jgi:uncharacterized membrane protein
VFSLLTGVGAFLWYSRGKHTKPELTRFLWTRGVWLIFLEVVVTRCFGWAFNFDYRITVAAVLWVLGLSMIVLAGAVRLPLRIFTGIALFVIAAHNLLGGISAKSFGGFAWLWRVLHEPGPIEIARGHTLFISYTLIPWFAVMMAGYSLGHVYLWEAPRRRRFLLRAGTIASILFIAIRAINHYGDPAPWSVQKSGLFTVFSFINTTKYPPSLAFLPMTLGPAMILLGLIDSMEFHRLKPVVTFGRVPLFYYTVHIPAMHLIAIAIGYVKFGAIHWFFTSNSMAEFPSQRPPGWGFSLIVVYIIWICLVAALYPLCRRYAEVKRRGGHAWLSYF